MHNSQVHYPQLTYGGTPLKLVTQYEITLTCDGCMHTAAEMMADKFRSAIARVTELVTERVLNTERCHAVTLLSLRFDSWSVMVVKYGPLLL